MKIADFDIFYFRHTADATSLFLYVFDKHAVEDKFAFLIRGCRTLFYTNICSEKNIEYNL